MAAANLAVERTSASSSASILSWAARLAEAAHLQNVDDEANRRNMTLMAPNPWPAFILFASFGAIAFAAGLTLRAPARRRARSSIGAGALIVVGVLCF